jgi:hypothetical protein
MRAMVYDHRTGGRHRHRRTPAGHAYITHMRATHHHAMYRPAGNNHYMAMTTSPNPLTALRLGVSSYKKGHCKD